MRISETEFRRSIMRLQNAPGLLDIAGSFVFVYANALKAGTATAVIDAMHPVKKAKRFDDCIAAAIMSSPAYTRLPYTEHDVYAAIYYHAHVSGVPFDGSASVSEVVAEMKGNEWALQITTLSSFRKAVCDTLGTLADDKDALEKVAANIGVTASILTSWIAGKSCPRISQMSSYLQKINTFISTNKP